MYTNSINPLPLVSVIIPTYKRSELIEVAIESVYSQTYINIEIIIIDDNGNNKWRELTFNKIEKYLSNLNFYYLEHATNKGGSIARNTGIEFAHGDYISFLDDDDKYIPNRIEIMMHYILSKKNKYDAIISSMYRENEKGHRINLNNNLAKGSNLKDFILNGNIYTGMILISKQSLLKIGGFDDTPRFQDKLLMLKFYANNCKALLLKDKLHIMLEHSGYRTTLKKPEIGIEAHNIIFNKIKKHKELFSKHEWRKVLFKYYYGLSSVTAQGNLHHKFFCLKNTFYLIYYYSYFPSHSLSKLLIRCIFPVSLIQKIKNIIK